jgi:hypothetical protein
MGPGAQVFAVRWPARHCQPIASSCTCINEPYQLCILPQPRLHAMSSWHPLGVRFGRPKVGLS